MITVSGPDVPSGRGDRGLCDARPADLPALVDLWVAAWRPVFPHIDFEARRGWFVRHLDRLAAEGARTVVARPDGALLGFVTVDPGRALLDQLAVHPAHQGSGVASALLAAAKAVSPAGLDLAVNRDNERARRFYLRRGFVEMASGTNPLSGLPTMLLRWPGGAAE